MGGSAIGADIVAGMNECRVPIFVQRGYDPPPYIDENTLVIASSYSGTTEETNAAFSRVLPSRAKKLVMTTGGTLKQLASKHRIPCFTFEYRAPPRAALPYNLIPCLGILAKLGFIDLATNSIEEPISVLIDLTARIDEAQPFEKNPAKNLAQELHDKICIIYGSEFLAEVGHRWKIQINENAKAWADYEFIPELNHNAVVGYRFPADVAARVMVVMLDSDLLNERIRQRYLMTCSLMKTAGVSYHVVSARNQSKLAQMLSLVVLGDYVSYYIALLNQTDPYPLDEVDFLKRELSSYNGERNTKKTSSDNQI
jgi:glucose/mannose-6-phosphate isomerase